MVKPNPVRVEPRPVLPPWQERKNQMLFAGRLEELKGLPTVLEGLAPAGSGRSRPAGGRGGPPGGLGAAERRPKVRFLGQLAPAELHRHMAESGRWWPPASASKIFALVPAEAHMVGTPVLASGLGNVGVSVRPASTGCALPPGMPPPWPVP